jgi:hypothetical protein
VIADPPQQRLGPAPAEDGVVDVVLVHRDQIAVVAVGSVLVAVGKGDELNLRAGQCNHAPLLDPVELGFQDRPGRLPDRSLIEPDQVALHHGGTRLVWEQPDRLQVEYELHVAVPLLP